jgi:NAD(P)H-dependent FMN reductase
MWALQDLRRVLGIAGARVIPGEVAVPRAHEAFDAEGRLTSQAIAVRLREHLAALVDEAVLPALAA